ncbi:hypothetical protein RGQ13_18375 [Thalassotalea psychrophila]|uniref:Uncharacterized protein n=1 Tax=Thalassotalea psychrophila TaxID=3065647 RepID=A0ABY9TTA7_9GAMM|nr:hypothetical protein RGQ13_18375 [Colwelliaceae bacterium SQ149]
MNTLDNETENLLEPENKNSLIYTSEIIDDDDSNDSEVTASYVRGYN